MIFFKIACMRSRWLRWHRVGKVVDYADTCRNSCWLRGQASAEIVVDYADMCRNSRWLRGHQWQTLKASRRFWRKNWVKKCTWMCLHNSNNLKIWKASLAVIDYADPRFSNFIIKYLSALNNFFLSWIHNFYFILVHYLYTG